MAELKDKVVSLEVLKAYQDNLKTKFNEINDDLTELHSQFNLPVQEQVNEWINAHPEAITTVQNHSITVDKLAIGVLNFVTPEMYGAVGDGIADDTIALNNMFRDNCCAVFSNKIYKITGHINIKKSNTVIIGNGATIKVADDVGELSGMLWFGVSNAIMSNLRISGLNFDDNSQRKNANINSSTFESFNTCLYIQNANNILIEHCFFRTGGVWCIFSGNHTGDSSNDGLVIRDCTFHSMQKSTYIGGTDTSLLYSQGKNVKIYSNTFKSEVNSQTALEIHNNDNVEIYNNIIENYHAGILLIMEKSNTPSGSTIHDNIIKNVNFGVFIWGLEDNELKNVIINHNDIAINPLLFNAKTGSCGGVVSHRYLSGVDNRIVSNITIQDNNISFNNHISEATWEEYDNFCGIELAGYDSFQDVRIIGNTISKVDGGAIIINSATKIGNAIIVNNVLSECWYKSIIPGLSNTNSRPAIACNNMTPVLMNNIVIGGGTSYVLISNEPDIIEYTSLLSTSSSIYQQNIEVKSDSMTDVFDITQDTTISRNIMDKSTSVRSTITFNVTPTGYGTYLILPFAPKSDGFYPIIITNAYMNSDSINAPVIALLEVKKGISNAYIRIGGLEISDTLQANLIKVGTKIIINSNII